MTIHLTSGADAGELSSAAIPIANTYVEQLGFHAVFNSIREMLDRSEISDRNELLTVAIAAMIEAGIDTGARIVGMAGALGFNRSHARALLRKGREWQRCENDTYCLVAHSPATTSLV